MLGIVVSTSKGVIGPILDKLTELMEERCANLICSSNYIAVLRDELITMKSFLEKMEDSDELDPLAKDWRSQVREMAYDIEDCIDDFVHRAGSGDENAGFFDKFSHFAKTLGGRLGIAMKARELKTRLTEISERRKRYKFSDYISISDRSSLVDDHRLPALYNEASNLVGIEGPREEVIQLLTNNDQQLKVLSIVGFGGLGKTTLAKEVYHKIGGQFSAYVFFSVSQRPDIIRLLLGIQLELGIGISSSVSEVKVIIDGIRGYLQHNRYFIVVDDLWDAPTWDIIHSIFPENGLCSRVLVTTRVEDVATRACSTDRRLIYRMKPLSYQDSGKLLCREYGCPAQFVAVSAEILGKCDGLPLAVTTIANLLAHRPAQLRKEWERIRKSIGAPSNNTNPTWKGMRQILYLSYKNLPQHLRACFLYLGIFPDKSIIRRDCLIRQWIAEGFVHHLHGQDSEDAAKSCFNELINRSLIQPVDTKYGEVVSCRVHDTMLDFVLSKCAEDNFVTVGNDLEMTGHRAYKVRCLLLDWRFGNAEDATKLGTAAATNLSQLRSLQLLGASLSVVVLFKYLRVLILENTAAQDDETVDLTALGQLFLLRYLKVSEDSCAATIELPAEIQGLQYLLTLETRCTNGVSLPSDIFGLPRLTHLIVPLTTIVLPDKIGCIKSLHTLRIFDLSHMKNVKGLGELTSLRDLKLFIGRAPTATMIVDLVTSLGKLCNLRCLRLSFVQHVCDDNDRLGSLSHPPLGIERLQLEGWKLPRLPRWINRHLQYLLRLDLTVKGTSSDEVRVLGELPSLFDLRLNVPCCPQEITAIAFASVGFPALEHLKISCRGYALSHLCFVAGVMPNLRTLNLTYTDNEWCVIAPVGMQHLQSLRDIFVHTLSRRQTVNELTKFAFTKAIQVHPGRPILHLQPFP